MSFNHALVLILVFFITACDLQDIRPDNTSNLSEIIEIEKRASDAYQKEDWVTAEKEYQLLVQKAPTQSDPWFRLGNIYARTNRLDAAVTMYREALNRDSENTKIWHNLGIVQLRQATGTFIQMVNLTEEGDPLNYRGKQVINSVTNLLSSDFK